MWNRLTGLAWTASIAAVLVALWPDTAPWSAALIAVAAGCWVGALYRMRHVSGTGNGDNSQTDGIRAEAVRLDPIMQTVDGACGDLRVLRANLDQVRTLVEEATGSISRDFEQISCDIRRQQALVWRAYDDLHNVETTELEAITTSIDRRIESLVVSLQFGDIVNQLLEFTDRQAAEAEIYLDSLAGRQKEGTDRDLKLELSDGRKPTSQTTMQAGEIELF
jgi:hypothetical protein